MYSDLAAVENHLTNLRMAVTGHRGFLGRHLVAVLGSLQAQVLLLDGDVQSPETWTEDFDLLFHLAAVMPDRFNETPETAFAVNLNFFDVYVMLISGLVGYVLHRFGFPLAPLVLAVILGPIADENLRRALLVFEVVGVVNVLWDRKLGTVLLLVVLYTFYDGIFRRGQRKDSS